MARDPKYGERHPVFPERMPNCDPLQRWHPIALKADPDTLRLSRSAWRRGAIRVVSSIEWAPYPVPGETGKVFTMGEGPQVHLAASHRMRRPKTLNAIGVLRAFGVHQEHWIATATATAQHYWIALDPHHRGLSVGSMAAAFAPKAGGCLGCVIGPMVGRGCLVHAVREATPED